MYYNMPQVTVERMRQIAHAQNARCGPHHFCLPGTTAAAAKPGASEEHLDLARHIRLHSPFQLSRIERLPRAVVGAALNSCDHKSFRIFRTQSHSHAQVLSSPAYGIMWESFDEQQASLLTAL